LFGIFAWLLVLAIWTPFTLWRVYDRTPTGDVGRAGRFLALAWALLFVFIPGMFAGPVGLWLALLVAYVGGLIFIFLARTEPKAAPATP